MKPPFFDLLVPDTLEEALECLQRRGGDARILAGGQSLMAMLNMHLTRPEVLVDISRLTELAYIRETREYLEVGAATTQGELLNFRDLARKVPLLALAMPHIGHFQTRNRGTVCGSLAHADPSSELPLALALLEGDVVLRRARKTRTIKAAEFQTGMLSTARREDEIVVAARFPRTGSGTGFAFREIARRHGDFAIVALAAMDDGTDTRLAVGGAGDRPLVRSFSGLRAKALEEALNEFAWELGASDDMHASARYRRELVRRLGNQAIEEARNAVAA